MDVNVRIPRSGLRCLLPDSRRVGRLTADENGFTVAGRRDAEPVKVKWSDVTSVSLVYVHRGFRFIPAVEVETVRAPEPLVLAFPGLGRRYSPTKTVDIAAALRAASVDRVNATR